MENQIASMEAEEHIMRLEKLKMESELRIKQGIIDAQTAELLKLRQDFAEKAKLAEANGNQLNTILEGLNTKVGRSDNLVNVD